MTASEMETKVTTRSRVLRGRCLMAISRLPPRWAHQDTLQHLELLEALARAEHHGLQRRIGDPDRHAGLVPKPLVQPAEERAAAREDDAAIHDVGRELGGGSIERGLDGVD